MNGAGNDFMVFDARGLQMNFAETAKKLCALRHADGTKHRKVPAAYGVMPSACGRWGMRKTRILR